MAGDTPNGPDIDCGHGFELGMDLCPTCVAEETVPMRLLKAAIAGRDAARADRDVQARRADQAEARIAAVEKVAKRAKREWKVKGCGGAALVLLVDLERALGVGDDGGLAGRRAAFNGRQSAHESQHHFRPPCSPGEQ